MAVKEVKEENCKKVECRRRAVNGHSNGHLVSVSWASTHPNRQYAIDSIRPVMGRPISPLLSPEESEDSSDTSMHEHEIAESKYKIDYRELSVDMILDSPYSEVSRLLKQLDLLADTDLIIEMMLHFTLVINGLPDCLDEDLLLAVYFFIEDTFGIRSRLLKCVKIRRYDGRMDVGVIFDTIRMKYDVLKKDVLLEGTEVRIVNNHDMMCFGNIHSGDPRL